MDSSTGLLEFWWCSAINYYSMPSEANLHIFWRSFHLILEFVSAYLVRKMNKTNWKDFCLHYIHLSNNFLFFRSLNHQICICFTAKPKEKKKKLVLHFLFFVSFFIRKIKRRKEGIYFSARKKSIQKYV